jgi:hypothetical protein
MFHPSSGFLVEDSVTFRNLFYTHAEWMDYDDDEDLDLLVSCREGGITKTGIYRNIDQSLDTNLVLVTDQSFYGDVNVFDFNNDNRPDFSLSESDINYNLTIYENMGGSFSEYGMRIPGLDHSSTAWGDINSDGTQDLVNTGVIHSDTIITTYVYSNEDGTFENLDNLLAGFIDGIIRWVDVDSDGDLDLFASGYIKSFNPGAGDIQAKLYINEGGAFREGDLSVIGLRFSDVDFGDYDNDGDPDMVFAGNSRLYPDNKTYIYRNDNGIYTVVDSLERATFGKCRWADLNNDGLLDIILSGTTAEVPDIDEDHEISYIYLNKGNAFSRDAVLEKFKWPVLAMGDYNEDNRLDIFIGGYSLTGGPGACLYRNWTPISNEIPRMVYYPDATAGTNSILINWGRGYDGDNPRASLSYNVRVGTTDGGNNVKSSLSHDNGKRKIVGRGNSQYPHYLLEGLEPATTYYYAIQAIDHAFAASEWGQSRSITTLPTGIHTATGERDITIYPNPSSDMFTLRLNLHKDAAVRMDLINMTGQVINTKHLDGIAGINVKTFTVPEKGIYTLRVLIGGDVITKRIVKL